jgi:hypothetical protein
MSCIHAETTTLLWAYGEGPENHTDHIAMCAACREVIAMHESVGSEVAALLPVLRHPHDETRSAPAVPRANWVRWAAVVGALAAGLAFVVGSLGVDEPVEPVSTSVVAELDVETEVVLTPFYGSLDRELDELDDLVNSLEADASIL